MTSRRQLLAASIGLAANGYMPRALALDLPLLPAGTPLRMTLGFPPGGAVDTVARILAPGLSAVLSRPVVVENLTGANGVLALRRVAEVGGDISRFFFATSSIAEVISAASADRLSLQTMQPVSITSTVPMVLVVRSSLGVKDAAGFLSKLKSTPELSYGSAGIGNGTHMCAADLVQRLSATAIHIPFQGSHAAMLNLAGGHIDFATVGAGSVLVPNARVTPIAVTTGTRSSLEPLKDLPTVSEAMLMGFEYSLWQAAFAPASWDRDHVTTLYAAFKSVLSQESIRQALSKVAAEVVASSPATVSAWVEREAALHSRLASVIKKA